MASQGAQTPQKPQTHRATLFIFAFVFICAGGLIFFFWAIPTMHNAFASRSWPSVEGKVTTSQLITDTDSDGVKTYKAGIAYEYSIHGEMQKGVRVGFSDYGSSNISHAQSILTKYPIGAQVDIYYNPKSVQMAVLEPGVEFSTFLAAGLGLLCVILGFLLLFHGIKGKPETTLG